MHWNGIDFLRELIEIQSIFQGRNRIWRLGILDSWYAQISNNRWVDDLRVWKKDQMYQFPSNDKWQDGRLNKRDLVTSFANSSIMPKDQFS